MNRLKEVNNNKSLKRWANNPTLFLGGKRMSNTTKVVKEADNFIALITWLTTPNHEEIKAIRKIVKNKGVRALFINITALSVSNELKSKLIDLKNVIIAFDGDISEGGE